MLTLMQQGRSVLLAVIAVYSSLARCQRSCPAIGSVSIVHRQVVSINTNAVTNTTFYPIPQVALTVSNAPTSLDTLTTLSWTETTTAIRSETPLPSYFVLTSQQNNHQKRQSGSSYVAPNGTLTQDCANAVQYSLVNGQLVANASDGTIYYFSASPGVAYAPFIPTTVPGNVSTTFSITTAYTLSWRNAAFYNTEASFCSVNGTVYAVFQRDIYPDGCFFAPLSPAYGPGCVLYGNTGIGMDIDKC